MINLYAPLNSLGYGVASSNILAELSKLTTVSYFPIDNRFPYLLQQRVLDILPEHYSIAATCYQNRLDYDYNAPCIKIWHEHDMYTWIGKGKRIGFPFFELNRFPKNTAHSLKGCDEIFVASKWAKSIIDNEIGIPCTVIPLGVSNIFYPKENKQEKFIFCNIGKIEVRKGHDILIDAFNKAFSDKDDVELWMAWDNPFMNDDEKKSWELYYKTSKLSNKIKFIPRVNTQHDLCNLINQTNCGVFPYRAEAWNLELLEFMACGKQIIATNYSGPTEYLTKDNSFLLETDSMEEAYDGKWFFGVGDWCNVKDCMNQLIEHMRFVYKFGKVNQQGIITARSFSWQKTAKALQQHLHLG